jgi:hypothetical protein
MKAPLRHIKSITSGNHRTPEQLRLPFHTPNGCQGSVHDMCLQDMIQLCWSPTGTGFRQAISFVGKSQLILQVFPNPLCQLCGQPAQGWVSRPVYVLQPRWRGCISVWHGQIGCMILHKLNSAWFEKVEVKACATRTMFPVGLGKCHVSEVYTMHS